MRPSDILAEAERVLSVAREVIKWLRDTKEAALDTEGVRADA